MDPSSKERFARLKQLWRDVESLITGPLEDDGSIPPPVRGESQYTDSSNVGANIPPDQSSFLITVLEPTGTSPQTPAQFGLPSSSHKRSPSPQLGLPSSSHKRTLGSDTPTPESRSPMHAHSAGLQETNPALTLFPGHPTPPPSSEKIASSNVFFRSWQPNAEISMDGIRSYDHKFSVSFSMPPGHSSYSTESSPSLPTNATSGQHVAPSRQANLDSAAVPRSLPGASGVEPRSIYNTSPGQRVGQRAPLPDVKNVAGAAPLLGHQLTNAYTPNLRAVPTDNTPRYTRLTGSNPPRQPRNRDSGLYAGKGMNPGVAGVMTGPPATGSIMPPHGLEHGHGHAPKLYAPSVGPAIAASWPVRPAGAYNTYNPGVLPQTPNIAYHDHSHGFAAQRTGGGYPTPNDEGPSQGSSGRSSSTKYTIDTTVEPAFGSPTDTTPMSPTSSVASLCTRTARLGNRCPAVRDLTPKQKYAMVDSARAAQKSILFVCRWNGCGDWVQTTEFIPHLKTVHQLSLVGPVRVQCQWPGCTANISAGSLEKHIFSKGHVNSGVVCTGCRQPFSRPDALARHLKYGGGGLPTMRN